jgi:hypothetical protein
MVIYYPQSATLRYIFPVFFTIYCSISGVLMILLLYLPAILSQPQHVQRLDEYSTVHIIDFQFL